MSSCGRRGASQAEERCLFAVRCNTCILDYGDLAMIEGCTMQSLQDTRPATRRECKADILQDTRLETLQYILWNLKNENE